MSRHPEVRAQRASTGDGQSSFEGGLRPPPQDDGTIGLAMRRRLAGFARILRDNGFRVGLAETRDALAVLASPAAVRASSLQSALRALFCATHSDWEKFDAIFAAFWRGHDMRSARALSGVNTAAAKARAIGEAAQTQGPLGQPDRVQRGDGDASGGRARREGASHGENLAATDLRHITDPADIARAHELAARLAQGVVRDDRHGQRCALLPAGRGRVLPE